GEYFPLLARFLEEAKRRSTPFGSVFDNLLIVVTSELGRFPRLNDDQGKDHFPETPVLFLGRRINTGGGHGAAFGATGREMEAVPLRLSDGRPVGKDGYRVQLDDVGATLLQLTGVNPRSYGYDGRILDFLL